MLSFLHKYAKDYMVHVIMRVARMLITRGRLLPKSDTYLRGSRQWLESILNVFAGFTQSLPRLVGSMSVKLGMSLLGSDSTVTTNVRARSRRLITPSPSMVFWLIALSWSTGYRTALRKSAWITLSSFTWIASDLEDAAC